ncbi:Stk1 family PASTA domain-containing Ser/Thr kinase [Amycolatopsis nigrescens]|uniref:Stk1 family PASTA domain-containing Ser/Thr kinase n=1 Tax=Amycolatopsis nigrescens TaxID=381445 RepID=UPI000369D037|nr:Stk1 family PASTA domain-containing Ser/Thr kinase [Amycolatopsis nigrescens]
MTSTDTGLVGTLLDRRYRVDSLLARGGMSSVYRGVDTRLDRPVAIKIMDPRFADDRSFVERFEREARSAAKLHHPHVVAVHDQGVDGHAFLVMELVDGGTLRDLLDASDGALDVALALSVADPVLSALAAAHEAGLVHRDVKPENVLIGRGGSEFAGRGVVKVGDFGLVRAVASAGTTSSSIILGTVAYLAPEQVTTGAASERGDVYSAGILLYEMLTGGPPYTGDTAISVAYRHVNDDVPAPSTVKPGIPPALDDLVLRATRRDPAARPADAGAFLHELRQVRAALGVAPVAVPVPNTGTEPEPDAEKTRPAMPAVEVTSPLSAVPAAARQSGPQAGPRGTMALNMGAPPVTPVPPRTPPPHTPPTSPQPVDSGAGPSRSRRTRWIALAAAVVLLGGLIGAGVWWFGGGRYVAVPQVTGRDQIAAEKILRDAQLAPRFTKERNNTVRAGTVIRTEPGDGTEVLLDEEVVVVLSLGRPVVPNVAAGVSPEQAESELRAVQLAARRDGKDDKFDPTVPTGAVLGLNPPPGTQLDIGSQVLLVLSKGPAPKPVPGVVGKSKDDAFKALRAAGFEPVDGGAEFSDSVPAGSVTRTNPAAGATVDGGADKRVTVWVSEAVEVPSVVGRSIGDAVRILSEAGLQADVKGRRGNGGGGGGDDDDDGGFGIVIGQQPEAGKRVKRGENVKLDTFP